MFQCSKPSSGELHRAKTEADNIDFLENTALKQHIQTANLISLIRGKGYKQPRPQIPPLTDNGWEKTSEWTISPKKCLELPAPEAVLELVKC